MLLRIRSRVGTERVEVLESDTLVSLKEKVGSLFNVSHFSLSRNPNGTDCLQNEHASLQSLRLKHGDMLFLISDEEPICNTSGNSFNRTQEKEQQEQQQQQEEDEIDKYLSRQNGWTERKRDEHFCHHGNKARCAWCTPIPPWAILEYDPWKKDGVRFLPFHAYLRKLEGRIFDQPTFTVKASCPRHFPWPEGICTECAPSGCRIDSQPYRHVDQVEFDSSEIVDKFIQFWRDTGLQRCGYLYGKYIPNDSIPLGITARVAAIYEPPQRDSPEGSLLIEDLVPSEGENSQLSKEIEAVEKVASAFGLRKIGFIWTDLRTDLKTLKPLKHRETLLSGEECFAMAKRQLQFPSVCKQSTTKVCGSKFVSVLVTGTSTGEVELQAYQVSDQCIALVRDGIIAPAKKQNEMRVRKSKKLYIPEVTFRAKDEYNHEVVRKAEPNFPIEFFIIPIRHSAPKIPNPLFKSNQFPIENREKISPGTLETFKRNIEMLRSVSDTLYDFHLVVWLAIVSDKQSLEKILNFIRCKENSTIAEKEVKDTLLQTLLREIASNGSGHTGNILSPAVAPLVSGNGRGSSGARTSVVPIERQQILLNQLSQLGVSMEQARQALIQTNYQSVEAALEFLFPHS